MGGSYHVQWRPLGGSTRQPRAENKYWGAVVRRRAVPQTQELILVCDAFCSCSSSSSSPESCKSVNVPQIQFIVRLLVFSLRHKDRYAQCKLLQVSETLQQFLDKVAVVPVVQRLALGWSRQCRNGLRAAGAVHGLGCCHARRAAMTGVLVQTVQKTVFSVGAVLGKADMRVVVKRQVPMGVRQCRKLFEGPTVQKTKTIEISFQQFAVFGLVPGHPAQVFQPSIIKSSW